MRAEMLDLAQVALGVDVGGPHPNVRHRVRGVERSADHGKKTPPALFAPPPDRQFVGRRPSDPTAFS